MTVLIFNDCVALVIVILFCRFMKPWKLLNHEGELIVFKNYLDNSIIQLYRCKSGSNWEFMLFNSVFFSEWNEFLWRCQLNSVCWECLRSMSGSSVDVNTDQGHILHCPPSSWMILSVCVRFHRFMSSHPSHIVTSFYHHAIKLMSSHVALLLRWLHGCGSVTHDNWPHSCSSGVKLPYSATFIVQLHDPLSSSPSSPARHAHFVIVLCMSLVVSVCAYSADWASSKPAGFQRHHLHADGEVGPRPRARPELQDHLQARRWRRVAHSKSYVLYSEKQQQFYLYILHVTFSKLTPTCRVPIKYCLTRNTHLAWTIAGAAPLTANNGRTSELSEMFTQVFTPNMAAVQGLFCKLETFQKKQESVSLVFWTRSVCEFLFGSYKLRFCPAAVGCGASQLCCFLTTRNASGLLQPLDDKWMNISIWWMSGERLPKHM